MTTEMIPFEQMAVPAHIAQAFQEQAANKDLASSFVNVNSVSFRGKVWRINVDGEENVYTTPGTDDPSSTIEVVMVKANPNQSRTFYAKAYVEGEDAAPTCASRQGIVPDEGVEAPQSATCATCPQNVVGSRITAEGKKAKACSNNKRMAVLPAGDLDFGPLLLRIPSMSLSDNDNKENEKRGWFALAEYAKHLSGRGAPYSAVVTKIGFDPRSSYPKLLFKAVRYLTEEELAKVKEVSASDEVLTLIGMDEINPAPVAPAASNLPPAAAKAAAEVQKAGAKAAKPAPAPDYDPIEGPVAAAKPAPKAAKPAPVTAEPDEPVVVTGGDLSSTVDDILGGIGAMGTDD